jgi:hypothetical protein
MAFVGIEIVKDSLPDLLISSNENATCELEFWIGEENCEHHGIIGPNNPKNRPRFNKNRFSLCRSASSWFILDEHKSGRSR